MEVTQTDKVAEPLSLKGHFRIFDYFVSHSQLLLRCSETDDQRCINTDILFEGVEYIELPTFFEDPTLSLGNKDDLEAAAKRSSQPFVPELQQVFVVQAQQQRYLVVAVSLEVSRNELPPLESSIDRW